MTVSLTWSPPQTSVNSYKESHHPAKTYRRRPEAIDMLVS